MNKPATSFRITEAAQILLEKLAEKLGIAKTAVVELAVRELAKKEGVK